jgi:outer membrane receptor protein involved in Fe transport
LYGGLEFSRRETERPFQDISTGEPVVRRADWDEDVARAYLYWTPHSWIAAGGEYYYERSTREKSAGEEEFKRIKTHAFSPAINFFHPAGLIARLRATYVDQEGRFGEFTSSFESGDDQFWVVDASIGYRLPKRYGIITLEARNLFDEDFKYQEIDSANLRIYPDSIIFARFTLAF